MNVITCQVCEEKYSHHTTLRGGMIFDGKPVCPLCTPNFTKIIQDKNEYRKVNRTIPEDMNFYSGWLKWKSENPDPEPESKVQKHRREAREFHEKLLETDDPELRAYARLQLKVRDTISEWFEEEVKSGTPESVIRRGLILMSADTMMRHLTAAFKGNRKTIELVAETAADYTQTLGHLVQTVWEQEIEESNKKILADLIKFKGTKQ